MVYTTIKKKRLLNMPDIYHAHEVIRQSIGRPWIVRKPYDLTAWAKANRSILKSSVLGRRGVD
jgi:hypothetical protein